MQMIQGTAVELIDGTTSEMVENVLIGEPDGNGFTLAIPKGDTHEWTDKCVRFFGDIFRTIGFPQEGIEANIPLQWNKKIRVERMRISGDITVYEKGNFVRRIYKDVFFSDERGQRTEKTGNQPEGDISVKIYSCSNVDYTPRVGDIIVLSAAEFELDNSDERAFSESLKAFRRAFPNNGIIREIKSEINGEKPDISLTAR